jgi:hypothetical protein
VVGLSLGGASTTQAYAFALAPGAQFSLAWAPRGSSSGAAFFAANAAVSTAFDGNAAGNYRYPFKLAAGQSIAAGPFVSKNANFFATLAFRGGYVNSHWLNAGNGYIGFKFNTGAGVQYAWAQLSMDTGAPQNFFTLVDYAWGDVGDVFKTGDLTVAAVPEPATFGVGLLATGAIGVSLLRRRRAALKATSNS